MEYMPEWVGKSDKMLGSNLRWNRIPSRCGRDTPRRFLSKEYNILIGHFRRGVTVPRKTNKKSKDPNVHNRRQTSLLFTKVQCREVKLGSIGHITSLWVRTGPESATTGFQVLRPPLSHTRVLKAT